MSLETDPSKPSLKVKESVMSLLKAAGEAAFLNGGGTISNLIDAAGAMGRETESGAQAAHGFWRAVLAYAVMDVIGRNKIADLKNESGRLAKVAEQFGPVMEKPVAYDAACLDEPTGFKPYQDLREKFWEMIIAISPDRDFYRDCLERQLDNGLREGAWKVWVEEKSVSFRNYANSVMSGPVAEGFARRQAWQRHYSWIDRRLSKQPLFGQEETGITLRDVYTPLRCNHHQEIPSEYDNDAAAFNTRSEGYEKRTRRVANIGWLDATLDTWLEGLSVRRIAPDPANTIRIVAGPPGSGKSVFSRVFAHDVAMSGRWNVAYAELQHMSFKDDFKDRVRAYFASVDKGAGLGDDIFKMSDVESTPPVLFVFDGLDELSRSEEAAKGVSEKFIRNVRELLGAMNRGGLKAAAIVLGRSVAVKDAFDEADAMKLSALLHVMPLKPLDQKTLEVGSQQTGEEPDQEDFNDPAEIRKNDDRKVFWKRWLAASGQPEETEAMALVNKNLDDLTAEPLLFYLLILSGYADKDADRAADNRNRVYREIFRRVHKRDKGQLDKGNTTGHPSSHRLNKKAFFHLMECLGLAIWQGGGRTGSKADFEKYRGLHAYDREELFEDEEFASLKNVALQFYTRSVGDTDQGFEFVHKSFGEYLAGCALLRAARELSSQFKRPKDFCLEWLEMFGVQPVTPEIQGFLKDQCRLEDVRYVKTLKTQLIKHMNWVLDSGFPAHKLDNISSWSMAEARQRNATGALMAVLSALASAQGREILQSGELMDVEGADERQEVLKEARVVLDWPDTRSAQRLIETLQITNDRTTAHYLCLGWLDFTVSDGTECILEILNLRNVDLSGASLNGAFLFKAQLASANLSEADLCNADLSSAYLGNADLSRANLNDANMYMTNLAGADLFEANLSGASLFKANLSEADLSRANLSAANMYKANLSEADLSGADLSGAETIGADFGGSLLVSADLHASEGISQDQINSALGSASTLLPDRLIRPDHWLDENMKPNEIIIRWRAWLKEQND
ncbi:pentapeptide repeat-containing protein [uncultured Roseibium sp.]|uniref:pentapeptide repeat-containing protein n=1 Tax=uncultured Roseibium sp. TaxID=1936171 RepID=UPI0032170BD3